MRRSVLRRLAAALASGVMLTAPAMGAELSNGATGAYLGGSASSAWYPGGNHWRGHHSLRWREKNPDHLFSSPGWGAPWFYTPRTYYEPYRPRIAMPEPWSAQWYAYCSDRFRSFEPSTGLYTTYSGDKRMCW